MPHPETADLPPPLRRLMIQPGVGGFRRSQLIEPRPGFVRADVEDDVHRFSVEIRHDGERITDLAAAAQRWPWSTCPDAAGYLGQRMKGALLGRLADVDSPLSHCTHMHDLALLAAAHAFDDAPTLYTSFAGDDADPAQHAQLLRNGRLCLDWMIRDSIIVSPGVGAGRNLRRLKEWEAELSPGECEMARVLRRTVFVSGVRSFSYERTPSADTVTQATGACYTFQPARSAQGICAADIHDFSSAAPPLADRIMAVAQAYGGLG